MSFNGLDVFVVETGTEIEWQGEKLTVTETNVVHRSGRLYVTKKQFDAIKAATIQKEPDHAD